MKLSQQYVVLSSNSEEEFCECEEGSKESAVPQLSPLTSQSLTSNEDSAAESDSDFHATYCETELQSSTSASSTQISNTDEEEPSESADPCPPQSEPYFLRTTALKVDALKSTANQ